MRSFFYSFINFFSSSTTVLFFFNLPINIYDAMDIIPINKHIIPLFKNGLKSDPIIVLGMLNSFWGIKVKISGKQNLIINISIPIIINGIDKYFNGLVNDHVSKAIKRQEIVTNTTIPIKKLVFVTISKKLVNANGLLFT